MKLTSPKRMCYDGMEKTERILLCPEKIIGG